MPAPSSIDEYLAGVEPAKRAELERLRSIVHDEAPEANETIAYNMPAFRLGGRYLLGFAATKTGCSFYPGRLPAEMVDSDLAPYKLWKGTINYDPAKPISDAVVRQVIRLRLGQFGGAR
jgi:uncharacterized protein YdhG (YjbR/CyaY superfamily)